MQNLILSILVTLAGLLPHRSMAQLDFEDLLADTPAAVEEKTEPTAEVETVTEEATVTEDEGTAAIAATAATVTETAVPAETDIVAEEAAQVKPDTETAPNEEVTTEDVVTEEIAVEETVEETADETPADTADAAEDDATVAKQDVAVPMAAENPEPVTESQPAEDDFMAQYINEINEKEQKKSEAAAAQSDAMRLMLQKDDAVVLPDDTQELQKQSEKILKEQKKLLQATQMPEMNFGTKATDGSDAQDESAQSAPFGLQWGVSKAELEAKGFELKPIKFGDFINAYLVKNPQQQRAAFDKVTVIFGVQDRLNTIYAQSPFMADTPRAEKVLQLFDNYYEALDKKYNEAQKVYIPAEGSSKKIGHDAFLQELKEEKATLFATFTNGDIKITLSVLADAEAHSYIVLNYENTRIKLMEQEKNLNELINDL